MKGDFERINAPRVQKMIDTFDMIVKSARSNRIGERQILDLMQPFRDGQKQALAELTVPSLPPGMSVPTTDTAVPTTDTAQRRDITLWQEAQTAPLDELMMAYTTITARLADLVDEVK